ncbi:MAG: DUF4332 domain-containing protein [Alphaproteobacteria bacterium]
MAYKITEIEGIGPTYAEKLAAADITTTDHLLEKAAGKTHRKHLAEETGISEKLILSWANKADLMRIKGVGEEYSDLLEAAGVDTVKELKHRNAANLTTKMEEVNAEKNLVRSTPSESTVEKWIEQAKDMDAVLTY